DIDGDGDYDVIYGYGGCSFSFWDTTGNLVYDSGNSIAINTLNINPTRFNDEDGRSDDKGAEPEAVAILEIKSNTSDTNSINNRYILAVAMERTDGVLLYDVTNPNNPIFLTWLEAIGDEAPESLLMIPREDSGNDRALLIISNEDSGTVNIYQNNVID
ncbi:alkaline phosphatase, partial [Nonlabens mediterrranea]|nr:alkaline phosphatase [Nonlabens mediterrranea]